MTDDLDEFRAARNRAMRGPRSPLALVNAQRVDLPQPVWPVPGEWTPTDGGLLLTASAEAGITVDGVLVDGSVVAAGDSAVVPSSIGFADGKTATISGRTLRVWDPASEALQRFDRIDVFPRSERWVLAGRYTPASAGLEAVGTVTDAAGDPLVVAGSIAVTIDRAAMNLTVVRAREMLQLIFHDRTSTLPEDDPGSTYSMGRFLFLADPGEAADVVLDFNRAVLPPCAFSYQYACPIPPAENRFPVAIHAGERHPIATDGTVPH